MAIQGVSGNSFDNSTARTEQAVQTQKQQGERTLTPAEQTIQSVLDHDPSAQSDRRLTPAEKTIQGLLYGGELQSGNVLASQVHAQSANPVNVVETENEFGGKNVTIGIDMDGNGINEAEATEIYDADGNLLATMSMQDADQDGNAEFAEGFVFDANGNVSSYAAMLDDNDDRNVDYMYMELDTNQDGTLDTFTESLFDQNGAVTWQSSFTDESLLQSAAPAAGGTQSGETEGSTPPASAPAAAPVSSSTTGTFVSENAGYSNAVYTYDLDDAGQPTNIRPVIDNTNAMQAGAELGDISVTNGVPNLLVLANGANAVDENSNLAFVDGQLTIDGQAHGGPAYFSHDASLSTDGENHFKLTSGENGATRVLIEDLPGLGDRDFNDLVLDVDITAAQRSTVETSTASGTFDSEKAGYSNALYTYDLDDQGNPTNIRQLIDNTNDPSKLGTELSNISISEGRPNLLLLPNGANAVDENSALTFENGQLKIDGANYGGDLYFSHDPSLGSDGLDHFQYEVGADGSTRVFIEDLKGLGDRDFDDLQITVNAPEVSGGEPPAPPPPEPPVDGPGGEPPVGGGQPPQPPQRDDGTDVYVIDSLGDHGQDVTSVVQATAGADIDVALSGLPGINDFDLPTTRADSAVIVNENVQALKGSLETAFVDQPGQAALQDPGIQDVLAGLDEAMANFENGTETLSDFLMVEESLTLLQFIDPVAAQNLQFQLTSATNYHLNNFSDGADVQQLLNGSLTLTPDTRLNIGNQQTGYDVVTATLESFAQQYHAQDISQLGSLYGQIAALTVGGVTADLQNGLALSGLVDAQGQAVPVAGFGPDEQPVRVANVSAGVSLADIVAGSAESRLLSLFPPPENSVMGQSIAALNPGGGTLSIDAAIANSALQQMNDPSTIAGQLYADNLAAQEAYVQSLLDANIIIVAAAGNSGDRIPDADPEASRNLLVSDSMISVGASNAQGTANLDDDTLAGFSSAGADFVAEGENLQHQGEILNGTSFSAPIVSGLIARIAEDYPDLSAEEILAILLDPANRDVLFADIEGTEQDGLGVIREDALDQVFANQP